MPNTIALSNVVGHPDIFLTMTYNPKWPEITRSPFTGQRAEYRPELSARVIRIKLRALMSIVLDDNLSGNVVAQVNVI